MNGWIIYLICHIVMMFASMAICDFISKVEKVKIDTDDLISLVLLSAFLAPITFTIYTFAMLFILIDDN